MVNKFSCVCVCRFSWLCKKIRISAHTKKRKNKSPSQNQKVGSCKFIFGWRQAALHKQKISNIASINKFRIYLELAASFTLFFFSTFACCCKERVNQMSARSLHCPFVFTCSSLVQAWNWRPVLPSFTWCTNTENILGQLSQAALHNLYGRYKESAGRQRPTCSAFQVTVCWTHKMFIVKSSEKIEMSCRKIHWVQR